jgi:hypothetical protein
MNMIVPAGGNRREWVPSDPDQLVKTASTEDGSEVVEKDDLLEAAMGVLENQKQVEASDKDEDCEKCCEECDCDPCECESKEEKEASEEGDIVEASEEGEATEAGALCGVMMQLKKLLKLSSLLLKKLKTQLVVKTVTLKTQLIL